MSKLEIRKLFYVAPTTSYRRNVMAIATEATELIEFTEKNFFGL